MRTSWAIALTNFHSFLPRGIERWVLAIEQDLHASIFEFLSSELTVVECIRLGVDTPDRVSALADRYLEDERCGFIEFAVTDASEMDRADVVALMRFARWPEDRVRFCFDVADWNFPFLFQESSSQLAARSRVVLPALQHERLQLRSGGNEVALFDIGSWTEHTGINPSDYILPTGELECEPTNANGVIQPDGWIIGTLPFGTKYGQLRADSISLELKSGKITRIGGTNSELIRDLTLAIEKIPALEIVAELGFGISAAVTSVATECAIGCLWHERHFGAHVGIGATLDRDGRETGHHLDFVFRSGRIEDVGGKLLLTW